MSVLESAEGKSDTEVAGQLGTTRATVGKWRRRFLRDGCDGLPDEPRSGAPRTIGDEEVERVVVKTLESLPRDATHWSTRSMAQACGLSAATVRRIWRAFALKPHRCETFKLSRDPQFIEKVRDIVGLYLHPPERAVGLCVDEKARIQALDRTQPVLPILESLKTYCEDTSDTGHHTNQDDSGDRDPAQDTSKPSERTDAADECNT